MCCLMTESFDYFILWQPNFSNEPGRKSVYYIDINKNEMVGSLVLDDTIEHKHVYKEISFFSIENDFLFLSSSNSINYVELDQLKVNKLADFGTESVKLFLENQYLLILKNDLAIVEIYDKKDINNYKQLVPFKSIHFDNPTSRYVRLSCCKTYLIIVTLLFEVIIYDMESTNKLFGYLKFYELIKNVKSDDKNIYLVTSNTDEAYGRLMSFKINN